MKPQPIKNRITLIILLVPIICFNFSCRNSECNCPEFYGPVCGNNGIEYTNYCFAECDNVGYTEGACPVRNNGMIKLEGDSTMACYVQIQINGIDYVPLAPIQNQFVQDSLWVNIRYRALTDFEECTPNLLISKIEVLEIDLL
ncbi:MAG: Kazal-type serine protease inhibitor domain-containing protein [Bacteroidales bacterium]|nr:Kazal-type serine protease inhibitor domain-containing protein [Bacteroidales bacterium]